MILVSKDSKNKEKFLFSDFLELVSIHSGIEKNKISSISRLGEDLSIVGDDAIELFMSIHDEFGTDFSNLNLSNYFPSECSADMHYYLIDNAKYKFKLSLLIDMPLKFFWWMLKSSKQYKTLTVGELFEVIKVGKWS